MNTRIQDIKTQALEWFARQHGLELVHLSPTLDPLGQKQIDEKFAELIVRECAAVADGNFNTGFCPVGGFITEHFGFER